MTTQPQQTLGINGIRLLGQRTGVGRMLESILTCMGELEHPFTEIKVYTPQAISPDIRLPSMARNVVLPSWLPNGLWEQITLPLAHGSRELLVCPSYVAPVMARCPVLLIHHGSYEGYPAAFPWHKRIKARLLYQASARSASQISTVSIHSKRDIIQYYGVKDENIEVIPDGVDTKLFRPVNDPERLAKWRRQRLGGDIPFILYVGKPTKRRNLPNLLEAISRLQREHDFPYKLLLIGTSLPGMDCADDIARLGLEDSVVTTDFATHEEIVLAYNASQMLVYPSSYEGFGMPVLEAMACGTPVIALDNTAFPEFSSGIAKLLPDAEPKTLANAIRALLEDRSWRAHVGEAGPQRAREYDWHRITEKYIALMIKLSDCR
jgi:glycosyltransferase involved in cell wall biosynthesis